MGGNPRCQNGAEAGLAGVELEPQTESLRPHQGGCWFFQSGGTKPTTFSNQPGISLLWSCLSYEA